MDLLLNCGVIGRFHGDSVGPLVVWSNRVDFFRDIGGFLGVQGIRLDQQAFQIQLTQQFFEYSVSRHRILSQRRHQK